MEGLFGLNMLLVRIGFELLRRRGFSGWLHRLIQAKLERVRRPGFLDKLLLRRLDLGFSAPQLRNIRAVAGAQHSLDSLHKAWDGGMEIEKGIHLIYNNIAADV